MQFPLWLRGPRVLEIAGLVFLLALLAVAFSFGWHRAIPGLGGSPTELAADDVHDPGTDFHAPHAGEEHDHAGHDHEGHDHEGHDAAEAIELTDQARRSMQLRTGEVELGNFVRRISVPATIVEWPGRTHVNIAAPLTGTVTRVHVTSGETIPSGHPLYTLRLTHQDLVQAQSEFLQTLGKADVEQQEVERLSAVAESGAIARRSLLERQYELDKLQAELRAERESLLLHGLSESQVAEIERTRRLIREVTIHAPILHDDRSLHDDALSGPVTQPPVQQIDFSSTQELPSAEHPAHVETRFVVTELTALRGQSVATGDTLTVLANYESLLAEGLAFQQDAEALAAAAQKGWPVQAVLEGGDGTYEVLDGLRIAYVGGEIREVSRALPFYVSVENEMLQQEQRGEHLFVVWRFKPGQRLRLRVPVERTSEVFVLPVGAIASEGPEQYVFVENGHHFDRRSVQVVLRDQLNVAVANDGSLLPGESVALSGAYQLQMALKNQSGGAVDPHAGHDH